jgi:protocatechuate 3,4-dioxygenase beta subunit
MQKIILLFILALAVLVGCNGQVPGDESSAAPPAAETIPASPSPPPADTRPAPADTAVQTEPADPLAAVTEPAGSNSGEAASLVPDCTSPAAPTPAMTEGPYYKTGSPERTSLLEPDMTGTRLLITGYVLTTDCEPIPGALLDFWQTDDQGQYDNAGFRLRGHQFTDETGRYQLETISPGIYPGRTAHIHVKVQAPNGPVLTSQLFLPEVPDNQVDSIFSPQLVMEVEDTQDGKLASFNFVLDSR